MVYPVGLEVLASGYYDGPAGADKMDSEVCCRTIFVSELCCCSEIGHASVWGKYLSALRCCCRVLSLVFAGRVLKCRAVFVVTAPAGLRFLACISSDCYRKRNCYISPPPQAEIKWRGKSAQSVLPLRRIAHEIGTLRRMLLQTKSPVDDGALAVLECRLEATGSCSCRPCNQCWQQRA